MNVANWNKKGLGLRHMKICVCYTNFKRIEAFISCYLIAMFCKWTIRLLLTMQYFSSQDVVEYCKNQNMFI